MRCCSGGKKTSSQMACEKPCVAMYPLIWAGVNSKPPRSTGVYSATGMMAVKQKPMSMKRL
jgi:hypothetical protein